MVFFQMKKIGHIFILFSFIFLVSCSKEEYMEIDSPMEVSIPSNFPPMAYDYSRNPPTKYGFELGKKLFNDGRLSSDNVVSCAFCHEQGFAFTHHGHDLSHGINDLIGIRNTQALQNLAFQSQFFWDGATANLEAVSVVPIHNPVEMNETFPSIIAKISGDTDYQRLFRLAFADGRISAGNMLRALTQFMTLMISADSKYDKYVRNEPGGDFSPLELQGKQIFELKCASCHSSDLFTDHSFRNTGLPINPNINDKGRAEITGDPADNYKFKVPSLRNVALTAPYFHDGRMGSLMSVLNFYSHGVQHFDNLDPLLIQPNGQRGIPLTNEEKQALIAFLNTLTDEKYINNPKFR